MDPTYKFPMSPGRPLSQFSPERVNRQSENDSPGRHSRDSSVHDKIAKFDTLAYQGKALERKTADAALKRAMLGREEAESEMRRYRDEARSLRKVVEEAKDRERKVGERLESVMENYGRAKETHAHTQALWEKEIRRSRKDAFKSQSAVVKLQEELKSIRSSYRISQGDLANERERSSKREQEAFSARYQLVGVQEDLANMMEKVKLIEQERDALRTIAKNEEIARIAAEGQIPLPTSKDVEFASPRKVTPLPRVNILSSAASEEEIEQLRMDLSWERRKAEKAHEHVEFLEVECQFRCCSCQAAKTQNSVSTSSLESTSGQDEPHESQLSPKQPTITSVTNFDLSPAHHTTATIFIPSEGVFRSVPPAPEESPWISPAKPTQSMTEPIETKFSTIYSPVESKRITYARTPSCEPPSTAIVPDVNTSLLSLLSYDETAASHTLSAPTPAMRQQDHKLEIQKEEEPKEGREIEPEEEDEDSRYESMPEHSFRTISTTTRIPLAAPVDVTPPTLPSNLDSALSPTMTREEALAMIRERRGRARSLAQGTLTPRKQMVEGNVRRDISAPAVRSGAVRGRAAARP